MKMIKPFSFIMLLAFLAFTFLHFTQGHQHKHPVSKTIIFLDDTHAKSQWDDEKKKKSPDLPLLPILMIILTTATISPHHFSRNITRNFIFLTPIFHQSNYVIHPPASKKF